MKRLLLFLLLTFVASATIAQSNTCDTANPFCSSNTYNFPNATSGTAPSGPNYGCLGSVPKPIWYYMEIGTSGTINISIQQTTGPNGTGGQIDVDFAMWGPFTSLSAGCAAITAGQAPLQCSFSASYSETIGLGMSGGTGSGASTPASAVAGQFYIVLLTNYSGSAGYISFNQTGGSGSADCAIVAPCSITNLTATPSACNTATNTYSLNGSLTVTNPPSSGNLVVENCDGTQTIVASAPFGSSTYTYTLNNLPSGTGACNVQAYFTVGSCSQLLNYTAPPCPVPCAFTNITANVGACSTGSVFTLTGSVTFQGAPTTGQLIIEDCNGHSQTFNAPFTSPVNYTISNIPANGAACGVTARFTADPACTINVAYTNAPPCNCTVDVGTFTTVTTGNNSNSQYVLCYGDEIEINSNNDFVYPNQVTNPPNAGGYDPAVLWLVYSCPPSVGLTPSATQGVENDPCLVGVVSGQDLYDINDMSLLNSVPGATNNTLYFVPLTFYHQGDLLYSYVNGNVLPCYEMGTPVAIQYLPEITTVVTPNCNAGTVSVNVTGGAPAVNGSNFTASNLVPSTATISTNNVANNGSIVISGLQDGDNYSFDIKDQYGCPVTITGTFQGVTPSGFTYPQAAYCKDATNPTPTITGATGGTFTATSGMVINSVTGVINLASTPAGTYTVTYTSPGAPCNSSSTFTVTINPLPTVTAPNATICSGQTATLTASGANTYSWAPATGLSATTGASVTSSVTANQTYTITGTNTTTGCTNTGTVSVTVNPLPTINAGADVTICSGATANLSASGAGTGGTYSWNNGLGAGATKTVSPTTTTTYTVTGTTASGCSSTDQVVVNVNPLPTVTASPNVAICIGASTTISASGAATYSWNNGLGAGASHTISPTTTTTYTVTGTDANGCIGTATVTVTVNPLPTINAGPDVAICSGASTNLVASGGATYTWNNGLGAGATHSVSPSATTTYQVTGTDANGCVNTDYVVVTVNSNPTPVITGTTQYCTGSTATVQTSQTYSTYLWSNGQTTQSINVTQANNPITVTVTNAFGCSGTSAAYTVTEQSTIQTSNTITICQGQSATIHGVVRTTAGVYANTLPSASGCDSTSTITLVVNPLPTINAGANQQVCVGTQVTLNATGAPSIVWSPVITNGVPFTQPIGTQSYTATGTDANGCINSASVSVTVNPLPTINAGIDQAICIGSSTSITASGGVSYTWNNGLGAGTTHTVNPTSTTSYTVTGIDANGCVNTDQMIVTVNSLPLINAGPDVAICIGSSTTLTASNGVSYTWNNGLGAGVSHTVSPTSTATYTVTGTDVNGCVNTDQVVVTVHSLPTVNAGADVEICSGASTTLIAGGAITYAWDNGLDAGAAQTVSPVGTTTYTVTGTDANGCVNTDQVVVTIKPNPIISPTADITVCNNTAVPAVTFTSNVPGTTYSWTANNTSIGIGSSGTGNLASFTGVNNGTQNVSSIVNVTPTANGCVGTADEFTITVLPSPKATISGTTAVCINGTAPTITFTGNTGTAPYTFTYTINGGAPITVTNPGNSATVTATTSTTGTFVYALTNVSEAGNSCAGPANGTATITVNALPAINAGADVAVCVNSPVTLTATGAGVGGTYVWSNNVPNGGSFTPTSTDTYTVTGTDANGCVNTDQMVVTVNMPIPVNAGQDQTVCIGSAATLTATSTDPAATFTWNNGVQNGVPFTPSQSKTYTVTSVDANGCVATDDVDVIVKSLPIIDAGLNVSGCAGDQFTFTGSGAGPMGYYTWSHGIQNGIPFTPQAGNYFIHVTGTDAYGCSNTDSLEVKIQAIPVVSFTASQDGICAPVVATFVNTSGLSNVSCLWSFDDGTTYTGCGDATHVFSFPGEYGASLQITSSNGCIGSLYQSEMVVVESNPVAHFTATPQVLTQISNEVQFVNGSYGASSYEWDFGDETTSIEVNPKHKYDETPNLYTVRLIAFSQHGCPDTTYLSIEVKEELIFYVPNTFTPDGDQYNETFKPVFTYGYDPYDYTLLIYNRWGEVIFESHDTSVGWEGLYGVDGNKCQDGTYTWKIEVKTTMSDERKTFVGHVNLLR